MSRDWKHRGNWLLASLCAMAAGFVSALTARAQDPFGAVDGAAACADLSEAICAGANTTFLAMCAGYVVVCAIVCVPWTVVWSGRGARGAGLKFALPLVIGALAAGLAVGFDPFASENYLCCAGDAAFRATLLLGESRAARGAVLGAVPFVVVYLIAVFVVKTVRK